jgi:hypothetical protein
VLMGNVSRIIPNRRPIIVVSTSRPRKVEEVVVFESLVVKRRRSRLRIAG